MRDKQTGTSEDLNDTLAYLVIPLGKIPEKQGVFFSEQFDLTWEHVAGGDLILEFRNNTDSDLSDFFIRLTLIESDVYSGSPDFFDWRNLAQDFTVPRGRYSLQIHGP